jgi:hypothetical protein
MFYFFDQKPVWKNQFEDRYKHLAESVGWMQGELFKMHHCFKEISLRFELNSNQQALQTKFFSELLSSNTEIADSIKRLGLICFRMCMLFSVLRYYEQRSTTQMICCSDQDLLSALWICQMLANHAKLLSDSLPSSGSNEPLNKREFWTDLPDKNEFQRLEAVKIGVQHRISERSVDNILKSWVKCNKLKKLKTGVYLKQ